MEMLNLIVDYYYTCAVLSLTSCFAIYPGTGGEGEDVFADLTHWSILSIVRKRYLTKKELLDNDKE